jgi:predicted phosphodiesterase
LKIAILSDIHGNFEALKKVWADIEQNQVDHIVCLGDMVGYGPEPEAVVNFIIEKGIVSLVGNHELATLENEQLREMSEEAYQSIIITRKLVSESSLSFIRQLPKKYVLDDMLFVHGMPPDSATTYLHWAGDDEIVASMKAVPQRMIFLGHTHRPICYSYDEIDLGVIFPQEGITKISRDIQYIINVGSVGQPRDGNIKAKYVIYDTEEHEYDLRLVEYDVEKTANQIIELGFPQFNAQRLWFSE